MLATTGQSGDRFRGVSEAADPHAFFSCERMCRPDWALSNDSPVNEHKGLASRPVEHGFTGLVISSLLGETTLETPWPGRDEIRGFLRHLPRMAPGTPLTSAEKRDLLADE